MKFIVDDGPVEDRDVDWSYSITGWDWKDAPGEMVYYLKRYNDQRVHPERPRAQAGPAFKQEDGTLWILCHNAVYVYTDGVGQEWMLD